MTTTTTNPATLRTSLPVTNPPRFVRQVGLSREKARELCTLAGVTYTERRPHYLCVDAAGCEWITVYGAKWAVKAGTEQQEQQSQAA
jgi:hypothetical protein